jgi:nucleotide-binding universal stress UspA family protein
LGVELAAACAAELLLVTVLETVWVEHLGERPARAVIDGGERERAAAALAQATAEVANAPGVERVQWRLRASSSAARGLHDAAVSERAEVIVVGSSHRGPLGHVLPGTVAERLLSGAPCAVAVAEHGHAATGSRRTGRIVVGLDDSPESRLALDAAQRLAACTGAALRAVTAITPRDPGVAVGEVIPFSGLDAVMPAPDAEPLETMQLAEALQRQESAATAMLAAAVSELGDGAAIEQQVIIGPDPATVIVDSARGEADMLVLGSRGYGPVRRALLGSISAAVISHAPCPVLITPRAAEHAR